MFSLVELQGQASFHKSGTIELNTEYHTRKKPVWLVALKLLAVLAMVAVGAAIAVPTLLEMKFPMFQAVAITAGGMLVYCGIAFFIRPEANTDNLGSDRINRLLWKAHCALGPGRFTAETLLDTCVLLGFAKGEEVADQAVTAEMGTSLAIGQFDASRPIALDPGRFTAPGNFAAGQVQLDSQRFFANAQPPA